ncbi:hypothetical protein [Paraburkholderia franconis]|uniref:hypothetical protein n=1 Tax=Paraburkholderia franconis TaxID=2654983 RepID=UPI002AB135CD|nr:hypothetical protein [Paraburkholderia franconis]
MNEHDVLDWRGKSGRGGGAKETESGCDMSGGRTERGKIHDNSLIAFVKKGFVVQRDASLRSALKQGRYLSITKK